MYVNQYGIMTYINPITLDGVALFASGIVSILFLRLGCLNQGFRLARMKEEYAVQQPVL